MMTPTVDVRVPLEKLVDDLARDPQASLDAHVFVEDHGDYGGIPHVRTYGGEVASSSLAGAAQGLGLQELIAHCHVPGLLAEAAPLSAVVPRDELLGDVTDGTVKVRTTPRSIRSRKVPAHSVRSSRTVSALRSVTGTEPSVDGAPTSGEERVGPRETLLGSSCDGRRPGVGRPVAARLFRRGRGRDDARERA